MGECVTEASHHPDYYPAKVPLPVQGKFSVALFVYLRTAAEAGVAGATVTLSDSEEPVGAVSGADFVSGALVPD